MVEVEGAVRGALEIAEVALGAHTVAVFTLSADDRELRLRECRSASDAVAREPFPAGEGALGGAVRRRAPVRLHGDLRALSYYRDGTAPKALLAVPARRAAGRARPRRPRRGPARARSRSTSGTSVSSSRSPRRSCARWTPSGS